MSRSLPLLTVLAVMLAGGVQAEAARTKVKPTATKRARPTRAAAKRARPKLASNVGRPQFFVGASDRRVRLAKDAIAAIEKAGFRVESSISRGVVVRSTRRRSAQAADRALKAVLTRHPPKRGKSVINLRDDGEGIYVRSSPTRSASLYDGSLGAWERFYYDPFNRDLNSDERWEEFAEQNPQAAYDIDPEYGDDEDDEYDDDELYDGE